MFEREVYRSTGYAPELVVRTYAKENRFMEEGGFRVIEVDRGSWTIREYVTQSDAGFSEGQLTAMQAAADKGVYPSWTLITPKEQDNGLS